MNRMNLVAGALVLASVPTMAAAQSKEPYYDCEKQKVVKPKPWIGVAAGIGCKLAGCSDELAVAVTIGGVVVSGLITKEQAKRAAKDNQECLAKAAEASLDMGEPITVALEGGATATVAGTALTGPLREYELPLSNPMLSFAEGDMTTIAKWYRTNEKKVPIMDSPTGGSEIGVIKKRKTMLFAMGHYGTGRALVEQDGQVIGYVDMASLDARDEISMPQFVDASSTRMVNAQMRCTRIQSDFQNAEDGAETVELAQCYSPLGDPDFFDVSELANG